KSTLLNALAGDELAKTSEFRPCTSVPTVYHPPGARLGFASEWKRVSGSALENLVVIDTPDSDTIVKEHREIVIDVLGECDLILMCADAEKYLDEATWSLLRPLQTERAVICIETKASKEAASVREDWTARLEREGFTMSGYFRVNSLRTFDRKVAGRARGADEHDFESLERFLSEELTKERIRRIKRSNTSGLLAKTVSTLNERVSGRRAELGQLEEALGKADAELAKSSFDIVRRRLFAEPHLWNYALGREMGLRAKGVVETIFRLLESARTIPARLAGFSLWPVKAGTGHQAASMLAVRGPIADHLNVTSDELRRHHAAKESELALEFAKAGFDSKAIESSFDTFDDELNERIEGLLRGPARDRIVSRARALTSWPLALGLDAPPLAFFGYSAYKTVVDYFNGEIWSAELFLHAATVLGIIIAVELFGLSVAARFLAWSARRSAVRDLRIALLGQGHAYTNEWADLETAKKLIDEIEAAGRHILDGAAELSGLKGQRTRG
ncbi:MAG: hypothetical protein QGD90_12425, partial [Candidatus Hydrogenedentes bacterium]|nr:hypothetical protein [Candidatus Hydrogenedentota bacterium]